jgi:hypothetical protein
MLTPVISLWATSGNRVVAHGTSWFVILMVILHQRLLATRSRSQHNVDR